MAVLQLSWIFFLTTLCTTSFAFSSFLDCPQANGKGVSMKYYQDDCFYFHMEQTTHFRDASTACWEEGGTLAMPKTDVTSHFLEKQIKSFDGAKGNTWVGMVQETSQDGPRFTWVSGERVEYKHAMEILKYGVPSIYVFNRITGVVNAHNSYTKNYFVCQIYGHKDKNHGTSTVAATTTPTTTTTATTTIPIPTTTTTTTTYATITPAVTPVATATITTNEAHLIEKSFCPEIQTGQTYMRFFGNSCFFFQVESRSNYNVSKAYCEKYGGTLARVKSSIIQLFLQYTMKYDFQKPEYSVWIGIETIPETGQYVWADGSQVTYTNFRYTFPINNRFAMSGWDDKWASYKADTRKNFVCQFESRVKSDRSAN